MKHIRAPSPELQEVNDKINEQTTTKVEYPNLTDTELYQKIEPLFFEDYGFIGFFYRGHVDLEQWRRVATDYLKNEYEIDASKYTTFQKGWYKVLPNGTMVLLSKCVRDSFQAMECLHD